MDGKTEVLRGQEFLPAHVASIKNRLPIPQNGCSPVPVRIVETGLDSGLAAPWLGTTEQNPTYIKPFTGALAEAQPTLFLIIHLTKRLS